MARRPGGLCVAVPPRSPRPDFGPGSPATPSPRTPGSPGTCASPYSPKLFVAELRKERQIQTVVPPHTIGDFYDFGTVLGSGGFGTVREIHHARTLQSFAGKAFDKQALEDTGLTEPRLRAVSEILLNADHACLVPILHVFEDARCYYSVMPRCLGGTLHHHLRELRQPGQPAVEEQQVQAWLRQLLLGLGYLHGLGVLHRDIKPSNLLFADQARTRLQLADFDMGVEVPDSGAVVDTSILGTQGYQAPEILFRSEYSRQTDLYACGASLCQMLTLFAPFHGEPAAALADDRFVLAWLELLPCLLGAEQCLPVSAQALVDRALKQSRGCVEVLRQLLGREPQDRPKSVAHILEHPWLGGEKEAKKERKKQRAARKTQMESLLQL